MADIFPDKTQQEKFDKDGYTIVDLLTEEQCDEILSTHSQFDPQIADVFFATQNSLNYKYRRSVEEYLRPIQQIAVRKVIEGYRILYSQYMVKRSGKDGECHMHQDWNYVREPGHFSIHLWCPLQDVDEGNGCMWVMPGSHRLYHFVRGRNIERATLQTQDLIRKFMLPVRLKKGQAMLSHSALIHESRNNMSGKDRIAILSVLLPGSVPAIHYMRQTESDEIVHELKVDGDFFVDYSCQTEPVDYPVTGRFDQPHISYSHWDIVRIWLKYKTGL